MYVDIALTAVVQWNKARGVKRQKKSPCCSVSVDGFFASSSTTDNSLLHAPQFVVTASQGF